MAPVFSRSLASASVSPIPFTPASFSSKNYSKSNQCFLRSAFFPRNGLRSRFSRSGLDCKVARKDYRLAALRCEATAAVAENKTADSPGETHEYQAEVSRLLDLIVHSLYSHKEVFLREFVSNASDALDKLRFLSGHRYWHDQGGAFIECLGTIAQSGTSRFLKALKVEEEEEPKEGEEKPEEEKKKTKKIKTEKYLDWKLANETKPIWMRNPKEVENEQYKNFTGRHLMNFWSHLPTPIFDFTTEVEFRSVLYIPGIAPLNNEEVMNSKTKNIRLYVKRVFISDDFDGELFPRYLSFVKGVVDSDDLPLNFSREILRESRIRLVKKTFDVIQDILENENKEDYKKFWENFGKVLKLGCIEDTGNHKKITPLLRFFSSKSEVAPISLDNYFENMGENQKAIYYS
ncbi:heat shock protein 90 [Striga asiatica]|uniref:Heat shock protein 90 n=1 Tax=Striga asiatica TaxID=4170 RepID=A0A5A7QYJ5_STRAF|nr:heat shock protein 90 [Striga asiatica]